MTKPGNRIFQQIPLEIVGGSKFGRFPKVSREETWNYIISDGWNVPFAGDVTAQIIAAHGAGRGIFASDKIDKMFIVIDDSVYYFLPDLTRVFVGQINTFIGDVFIEGNNTDQVAFSDSQDLWIYDNTAGTFTQAVIDFTPGYIGFQNGRFISPALGTNAWRISDVGNGLSWPNDSQHVGLLQTKPDNTQAAIRVPGRGNMLLVFGNVVTEPWNDVGANLFPYQRNTGYNIDYGCASPNTIASSDEFVVWLGKNEKSGYAIQVSNGGTTEQLSTDGINYQIAHLTQPANAYGFLFKQDGHVIYVITWPNDNVSFMYDFNTKMFFNLSDHALNYHIAKRVVFFNNRYYFISFNDGNLHELSSLLYTSDGNEIPRIRICPHIRLPDQSRFILANIGFTIEQGAIPFDDRDTTFLLTTEDGDIITTENGIGIGGGQSYRTDVPRIDFYLSKDGAESFGSANGIELNSYGRRQNRLMWFNLGSGNDVVPMFKFWAHGRFMATNGIANIYQ